MKIFLTVLLFLAGAVLIISLVSPYYLVASFYDAIRLRDYSIAQNFLSPDFESNLNRRIQKMCKMSESQGYRARHFCYFGVMYYIGVLLMC